MKIVLIDDEYPSRNELGFLIKQYLPETTLYEAASGVEAIELFAKGISFDVAFVDIHLGEISGTSLSEILKHKQPDVKIVFATAYDKYAVKAFDMEVTDYIMKPFDPERVRNCLNKVKAAAAPTQAPETIQKLIVSTDKKVVLLNIDDIAYLESRDRHCIIYTKEGAYASHQCLGYYEKKLENRHFFRVHKSFIINLNYVCELTPWTNGAYNIKLRGFEKISLPLSRKQVKPFKEIFDV